MYCTDMFQMIVSTLGRGRRRGMQACVIQKGSPARQTQLVSRKVVEKQSCTSISVPQGHLFFRAIMQCVCANVCVQNRLPPAPAPLFSFPQLGEVDSAGRNGAACRRCQSGRQLQHAGPVAALHHQALSGCRHQALSEGGGSGPAVAPGEGHGQEHCVNCVHHSYRREAGVGLGWAARGG